MDSFAEYVSWISANVWWLLGAGLVGVVLFSAVMEKVQWLSIAILIPSLILFYGAFGILITRVVKYLGQKIVYLSSDGRILSADGAPYVVVFGFLMGVILYNIRSKYLAIYGALEIFVGLVTLGISTVSDASEISARSIAIVGGVYVIVRGLDNIEKGLSEKAQERWKQVLLFNVKPFLRDLRRDIEAKAPPL